MSCAMRPTKGLGLGYPQHHKSKKKNFTVYTHKGWEGMGHKNGV